MYLELSDEQTFLVEAATGTLGRAATLESARAALDGDRFIELWPVAVEAGWPGLLVSEDHDGAGLGAYEAMLVLEACGASLSDARLLGHLPASLLIEAAGGFDDLVRELATGAQRAALVVLRDGLAEHVLDAAGADVLVAVDGNAAGVIEAGAPGVTVEPCSSYDATRSLATVRAQRDVAQPLELSAVTIRDGLALQRALLAAESVGAADACLRMARDYAIDRHAFGRSIGSYQAIKHKLVEMMRRIEASRSLLVGAGRAFWQQDHAEFALLANAARVAAADALDYAAPENIFIHGGVGATWEHDAQLYYRRAELSRRLAGGAEAAADDVAEELFARITR
jgi:alkylation response protein AidB-like acyl-CoA dehydrogenase